ncbi:LacI family transcriptional regulator [Arthrobacter sp. MYb229]|uniref:LacI family DNA-binding transcriptional regulator n=1 Tax=Micrococcaceae TaxID=1268 RepID=UPI000CFDB5A7|nr:MULTISPECIES: LacI family DNA-binding transcriptional regulator [unclassified Arthrobacter]PRA04765.1 LacI family transcriptional regulator [Arthrobacter sp. MYb229]PRB52124.1 LacI family transcriptional regulator [Arthrobacter sp. MYb216]
MSVSVKEVAREAGVSVGTVSNVLNRPEVVAPATVRKVTEAIDKLGFVRNDAARQLRAGHSRSFGLVILDARNPFFMDVTQGAQHRALENGYTVLMGASDSSLTTEQQLLDLFDQQRVAGVLISPMHSDLSRLWRIRESGTPVVLVDRGSGDRSFSSVSVNDVEGGRIAVQHLVELGRKRIAFVGGPQSIEQVRHRLEGAQSVIAGASDASLEYLPTKQLSVIEGRAAGERIVAMAPGQRPDGVFAANDLLALGILQAFVMSGKLKVPEDIALVGYDNIAFAESAVVPITTVRQPAEEIGRTAVDVLLREAEAGENAVREQFVFTPKLVIRASTTGTANAPAPSPR